MMHFLIVEWVMEMDGMEGKAQDKDMKIKEILVE